MQTSELEGAIQAAGGPAGWCSAHACDPSTGFASTLPSFGDSDGEDGGSESEDEDVTLAGLSHEELCEMLSETRAQLAQAAEMGQALMAELQQMELLKQDNAQLQEQKEEWEATQEEHEWRIEELEDAQAQLQETVEDQQSQIQELETQSEKQAEEHRKTVAQLRQAGSADVQAVAATASGSTGVRLDFAAEKQLEQDEAQSGSTWRRRVDVLEAELVDIKVETAELIESKRQMEEARVASERERKKYVEKELRAREDLDGAEKKLAKAQKMAEKGFAVATKATNRANSLELRLRMLEREFNYLREALQEPDKADAVEKRLFSLANVFADEPDTESGASASISPAAPPQRATRDLTLMISKNEIVPDNHRLKLKVASLMELEAVLQTKLNVEHPISVMVWDRAFSNYVAAMSFDDVEARSKLQIVKKEEPPDAAEAVKAELDVDPAAEPETEPESASMGSVDSASLPHELEREEQKVKELRISLAAAQADAEHNRKLTATANAQLKAALGSDRYEEQQRKRIARSVESQRTRCLRRLLENRFIDWKLSVQVCKAMKAAQTPEELAAMKAEQQAVAERRERDKAELAAKLESEQQKTAEILSQLREKEELQEQRRKEELMKAAFAQTQLPITGVRSFGAVPVVGADDKRYIVYRMLVLVATDKGGTPEMKRPWVVARKFGLFKNLRLALKAVPGQARAITAPFPKDGRRLKKDSIESEATAMERCGVLEAWVNEAVSKFRNHVLITEFLQNDGSDVAAADVTMVRKVLTGSGDAGESSNAIQISRCKLERVLGVDGYHRMGSRSPLEKSQFLLSTSRAVEGMPVIKKSHILSVLTLASRPDAARSKLLAAVLADLQHPFVHRSHDAQYGAYTASKNEEKVAKFLILRDFVPIGSIRDMLFANKAPMKGIDDKYPVGSKGVALEDETSGLGLRIVAKQVLLGMRYLESVGIPVDRIAHCGNVLVLHDGTQGRPGHVAISDVEVAALGMQGPNAKHIAAAQIRRPANASVYAFGLLLHELATGEQADPDAQQWPPSDFKVWSMPVQALLGNVFAKGNVASDVITTLAQVEEHHALRDIKLHDSQTDGMPDDDTTSALRTKYYEHLGFQAASSSQNQSEA